MARAGIEARKAELDLQRARYFPDIGLGLNASYSVAPSVVQSNNYLRREQHELLRLRLRASARAGTWISRRTRRASPRPSRASKRRARSSAWPSAGSGSRSRTRTPRRSRRRTREEHWDHAEHRTRQWIATVESAIDLGTKDERALMEPLRWYVNAKLEHNRALNDLNVNMSELARVSGWDAAAPNGH